VGKFSGLYACAFNQSSIPQSSWNWMCVDDFFLQIRSHITSVVLQYSNILLIQSGIYKNWHMLCLRDAFLFEKHYIPCRLTTHLIIQLSVIKKVMIRHNTQYIDTV